MAASPKDQKIVEMNRFLDDLERASQASPAAFDQAFQAPPSGLSVHEINSQKVFTRVSSGHRGLLGYNPTDMVGKMPGAFVVLKELSESATTRKLAPGAILVPSTRSFRKADNSEIRLLQVERHLTDNQGHITGIRTVIARAPEEA